MSDLSLQTAQRLVTLLAGAIKGIAFYPSGHPAVKQPLQEISETFRTIFQSQQEIQIGLHDGVLFLEEHLFVTPSPSAQDLAERFRTRGVKGILFARGVNQEALSRLVALLADKKVDAQELIRTLDRERIAQIRVATDQVDDEEEEVDNEFEALETYGKALEAIRYVIKDIESGRIPNSGQIVSVVKNMVTMTIQDPSTLLGLSMIKDYDNYTFNHCVNVGVLAMALAASLGHGREQIEEVGIAGFLHDIGKTHIDKKIINKPGKLTDAEFEEMKKHSEFGAKIIAEMEGIGPFIAEAVLGHHIKFNHQGYPEWAQDKEFNFISGIIAVADCYDAITTLRVYQRPMNPKAAVDKIHELAGTVLDANLVNSFVEMMGKYPVGTLVRLDSNEIAVVYRPNPANSEHPVVKVIFDPLGELVEPPQVLRLSDCGEGPALRIVAIMDPTVKNIEVGKYLS